MSVGPKAVASLLQRDSSLPAEPLGHLSGDEAMRAERDASEPPAHRRMREQLADQMYEARKMREWFESQIRTALPASFPFEQILEFADWKARELHLRDRYESMGFRENLG